MDNKDIGWYIVENQYHQSGNAYWDGDKWTQINMIKGSCMIYDDQKIVNWSPIYNGNKTNTFIHDTYKALDREIDE